MAGAEFPGRAGLRGFWALIVTQFQGAFSDNALKQMALFIGISLGMGEAEQDRLTSLTLALLTLPFLFFSMFGGALAARYSKRTVIMVIKVFEILIMARCGQTGHWLELHGQRPGRFGPDGH